MVNSYNGWPASRSPADFGGLDNSPIPGTDVRYSPGIRAGSVATIAFWWGWQWHTRVERLVSPGCWGYFFKQSANSAALLSCHSSGTAWDVDAPQHPNGVRGTLRGPALEPGKTKDQVVNEMLAYLEGVVYSGKGAWGGGTVDEMHAVIAEGATSADADRVAAKILRDFGPRENWASGVQPAPAPGPVPTPSPAPDSQVSKDQFDLNDTGFPCRVDGIWGPEAIGACRNFQFAARIGVDGVCGPTTRTMLHKVPSWNGGSHSAEEWQRKLAAHGWHIAVDNVWGDHSASILRQFQIEKGLTADGLRGPQSWTCLFCTVG